MMKVRRLAAALALATAATISTEAATAAAATTVTRSPVVAFQAAGDVGGGILVPGTTYPPTSHGFATLKRGADWIQVNIQTSGLPAGAYTVWWVVFDTPAGCTAPCDMDDLFNPDATTSVFYATGGVVRTGQAASFAARYRAGDDRGTPGEQDVIDGGSLTPSRAEVHNIVKYHGPASDDPEVLEAQTTTLLGACDTGANAVDLGPPFGVHCFDPQAVAHLP